MIGDFFWGKKSTNYFIWKLLNLFLLDNLKGNDKKMRNYWLFLFKKLGDIIFCVHRGSLFLENCPLNLVWCVEKKFYASFFILLTAFGALSIGLLHKNHSGKSQHRNLCFGKTIQFFPNIHFTTHAFYYIKVIQPFSRCRCNKIRYK